MNWTVYCMGDLPIFRDIINAVAMVFNSSLFNPSTGAGLVLVAMLISLILFVFPTIMGKPLSPFPLIFVFLLYFGGIVPRTTLQIEDMYIGTVTTVDNVPLIVAAPAAIAASISKGITDTVETAFSSPSQGAYLSLGAEGFVNPLKTLLVFRNTTTANGLTYFNNSLASYVRDCAVNSTGYDPQTLVNATDVLGYLTGLPSTGISIYYSSAIPLGIVTACSVIATNISNDYSALSSTPSPQLDAIINSVVPPRNTSPGGVVSYENAYNSVTSQILGNAQTAQQFMSNMLGNFVIRQGLKCANAASPADQSDCNAAFQTSTIVEQANIDAASNASVFTKTAIPLMNILLALFYAFSPIILGVALMSAAHGLKIIGGFLMFGAWTQSWMPIAAVLNYMVQEQIQYELGKFGASGITLANANEFYYAISMKVGLASELMALTPMISMALLSGSMFALSNVAGKFAQDRADEKFSAPDLAHNGPLVEKGAAVQSTRGIEVNAADGRMADGTMVIGNAANKTSTDIDFASASRSNVSHAVAHRNALTVQNAHTAEQNLSQAYRKARENGDTQTTEAQQQQMFAQADKHAEQLVSEMAKEKKISDTNKAAVSASLSAGMKFMGAGAEVDASKAFETAKSLASTDSEREAITAAVESAKSQSMSFGHRFALSRSSKDATDLSKTYGLSDSRSETELQSAEAAVTHSLEQSRAVGTSQKQSSDVLGAIASRHMSAEQFDQMNSSRMTAEQQGRYEVLKKRHQDRIKFANGNNPLNQQQLIDASIQSLASMGENGLLLDALSQSGAVAAEGNMLHDQTRETQTAEIGTPAGPDIGKVRGDTSQIDQKSVNRHAAAAASNRGSNGARQVHKTDAKGHAMKDARGNYVYQSETAAEQSGISHLVGGDGADRPEFTPDQLDHHQHMQDVDRSDIAHVVGMALDDYDKFEEAHPVIAAALAIAPAGKGLHALSEINKAREAAPVLKQALEEGKSAIARLEKTKARTEAQNLELEGLKKAQAANSEASSAARKTIEQAAGKGDASTVNAQAQISASGAQVAATGKNGVNGGNNGAGS